MENLNIVSGENKIVLNKQQCIAVELKFNVSKYGKKWSHIGDKLYYFSNPRNDEDKHNVIQLNAEEFSFIKTFIKE